MSMSTHIAGDTATFALEGLPSVLSRNLTFTTPDDAIDTGANAVATILGQRSVKQVRLYAQGGTDTIDVTLHEGFSWQDTVTSGQRTRSHIIGGHLQKTLYGENAGPLIPTSMRQYQRPEFVFEVQAHLDYLGEKKIIKTTEHGGGAKVLGYDPAKKALTIQFLGTCATSSCGTQHGGNARTVSQDIMLNQLCNKFPGAFSRPRMQFVKEAPSPTPVV